MPKKQQEEPPPPEPVDDYEEEARIKQDMPKTAPRDARFPNTNCSYWCFQMFRDYHRCIQLFDEGHEPCDQFRKIYSCICPKFWVDRWEGQIENGTFPGDLPNDCKKHKYAKDKYKL
ncbi:uncharacterized protein [Atheta coriaria]|uniref:uncharacterized protein n=1 Tax=Dalotia coriaria TaxID=877792 RepID=UPI0031F433A3